MAIRPGPADFTQTYWERPFYWNSLWTSRVPGSLFWQLITIDPHALENESGAKRAALRGNWSGVLHRCSRGAR